MKTLTDKEKDIIRILDDPLYTVEFCEEWLSGEPENVFANAPAALQQSMVEGFVRAVELFALLLHCLPKPEALHLYEISVDGGNTWTTQWLSDNDLAEMLEEHSKWRIRLVK